MKRNQKEAQEKTANIPEETGSPELYPKAHFKKHLWITSIAALLALVIALGGLFRPGGALSGPILAAPIYPQTIPYPEEDNFVNKQGAMDYDAFWEAQDAWEEDLEARLDCFPDNSDQLYPFFQKSTREFLSDSGEKNLVYAPLNVYFALGMLAEITDGSSRSQILDLLNADSIEELRSQANGIWVSNYRDDGIVANILGSSLWLNQNARFNQSTLNTLAEYYFASAYRGKMGSSEFNDCFHDWLNQQTGGMLEEQANSLSLDSSTIMALATTTFFKARWSQEFRPSNTSPQTFHSPTEDITCDFMHTSDRDHAYYRGEHFSATNWNLEEAGQMWFLLPDEGVSPTELLNDEEAMNFLFSGSPWDKTVDRIVHLSVPKFDACSDYDLINGLQNLGITDIFAPAASDFSPLSKRTDDLYISQVAHANRVQIDEEGCFAAAYTVATLLCGGMPELEPQEEIDFTLDRPFLFAITSLDGLPLFVGVVQVPN